MKKVISGSTFSFCLTQAFDVQVNIIIFCNSSKGKRLHGIEKTGQRPVQFTVEIVVKCFKLVN